MAVRARVSGGGVRRRAALGGPAPGAGRSAIGRQEQIIEIQRSRLLAAAVSAVDELGYANTTVAYITSRARVSRRTFYELFANCEECLAAVLEGVIDLIAAELAGAGLEGLAWRERVRRGLWVILSFFDREPALARVCVVGALGASPKVLERRREVLAALAEVVDEGRTEGARGADCTVLTAEGLVGAAFAIVHARLLRRWSDEGARGERRPLASLLGELMGLIVLPYLGPAAARRELAREAPASPASTSGRAAAAPVTGDPLDGVAMRLTYRTAKVLEAVAEIPGVNNRQVAMQAGISDQGQVSKLLARLERLGLLANGSGGHARGEPNAWSLTAKGQRIAQNVHAHTSGRRVAA
jgi:AcrR family transcriptional regulator/DNA-binding MarR family transcriptional regulator